MNASSASPANLSDASTSNAGKVTTAAVPPHVSLDDAGRIASDIACRSCGYNLRSLAPDAVCPECGADVGMSLAGDSLRYSDPKWVSGLERGMTYLLIAIVATLAGLLVGPIAQLVGVILGLVGATLVTAAEPTPPRMVEPRRNLGMTRVIARMGLVGGLLLEIGSAALFFGLTWFSASTRDALIAGVMLLLAVGLFLVGSLALLIHLRRLALRIPDVKLATQTQIVTYGFVAAYGLLILTLLIALVVMINVVAAMSQSSQPAASTGTLMGTAAVTTCLDLVIFLVFGVWSVVLANWYRMRFQEAAKQARDIRNG